LPVYLALQDGWYDLINRGIERRSIFRSATDYRHFVELLAQLPERFGNSFTAMRTDQPAAEQTDHLTRERLNFLVDGSREFRDQVLKLARGEATHRAAVQKRAFRLDWPLTQQRMPELKAKSRSAFADRRNDAGRDLALYVARRFGGYTLAELGKLVGVSYAAVAQAVERTERRIAQSTATRKLYQDAAATSNLKT
jgi:hypothetical protein